MSIYEKAAANGIRGSNLINIFPEKLFHHAAGVDKMKRLLRKHEAAATPP